MKVKLLISNGYNNITKLVTILAWEGYKVWIESEKRNEYVDKYVCFECKKSFCE